MPPFNGGGLLGYVFNVGQAHLAPHDRLPRKQDEDSQKQRRNSPHPPPHESLSLDRAGRLTDAILVRDDRLREQVLDEVALGLRFRFRMHLRG